MLHHQGAQRPLAARILATVGAARQLDEALLAVVHFRPRRGLLQIHPPWGLAQAASICLASLSEMFLCVVSDLICVHMLAEICSFFANRSAMPSGWTPCTACSATNSPKRMRTLLRRMVESDMLEAVGAVERSARAAMLRKKHNARKKDCTAV